MAETAAEVSTRYPPPEGLKLKRRETSRALMDRSDVSGQELASLAENKLGWEWHHDNGSHMIFKHRTPDGREITLSIPNHRRLKLGTKGNILKVLFPPEEN